MSTCTYYSAGSPSRPCSPMSKEPSVRWEMQPCLVLRSWSSREGVIDATGCGFTGTSTPERKPLRQRLRDGKGLENMGIRREGQCGPEASPLWGWKWGRAVREVRKGGQWEVGEGLVRWAVPSTVSITCGGKRRRKGGREGGQGEEEARTQDGTGYKRHSVF